MLGYMSAAEAIAMKWGPLWLLEPAEFGVRITGEL